MNQKPFNLKDAVAVLERTPASLSALLDGLPDTWIRSTEGEGTWSPYDVIGHLIHGERTDWIPRARHILASDNRPFESFDRMAQFTESQGKSLGELLETFADLRRENVAALVGMNLTEVDLERKVCILNLGRSRSVNCWRRGWYTISTTSRRLPEPWRKSTERRLGRGQHIFQSCETGFR